VVLGGSLSASVTVKNQGATSVTLSNIVIAGRPPGGQNIGGPYADFGGSGSVTLAAGQVLTVNGSRAFTQSDPTGSWYTYTTYQTTDGAWHDSPVDVPFTVQQASSPSPTSTPVPPVGTPTVTPTAVPGGNSSFVTRSGSTLLLNGQPFRFAGVNRYGLAGSGSWSCDGSWSTSQIDQWMVEAQQMGVKVVRFWAFQSATRSGGDFSSLDYVLSSAAAHNIHVLPVLENQWGDCSDGVYKSASWYAGGYKSAYNGYPESLPAYINQIVARYANNPAIFAWQIMNEAEDSDVTGFYNFAADISNRIRALDHNHLISFGCMGSGQGGVASDGDYRNLHSLPNIDLLEYHDYGADGSATPSWLATREQDAIALNKPLFIGEAGIQSSVGLSTRANEFQAKMSAFFGATKADAGYMIWSYRNQTINNGDDGYNFLPGDPLVNAVHATAGSL
jgi:hypothetical protein